MDIIIITNKRAFNYTFSLSLSLNTQFLLLFILCYTPVLRIHFFSTLFFFYISSKKFIKDKNNNNLSKYRGKEREKRSDNVSCGIVIITLKQQYLQRNLLLLLFLNETKQYFSKKEGRRECEFAHFDDHLYSLFSS
jgi:hypothetical protein